MSIIISSSVSQKPAAATADDKPMVTPEQVIEQLRVLREQIPEFVHLPNNREWKRLRRAAKVDVELVQEAVSAVGAADVVRTVLGNTQEEFRQAEDESARWLAVETEFRSVLRGVTAANLIRRERIAKAARQAYRLGRTLVEQEEFAHLLPHVDAMFRIKNRKRAKPAPPPEDLKKQ